jgi:two-component system chemotaxis response regulator CheY
MLQHVGSVDQGPADALPDRSTPILVVDDLGSMVRILRNLLHKLGLHNVDDAAGAEMALEKMREKSYGLVIIESNMLGMSGYELLREIRLDPRLEMTAVLVMTSDPNVVRFIRETDLTQYLIKPFSADMLKVKIAGLLSRTAPAAE